MVFFLTAVGDLMLWGVCSTSFEYYFFRNASMVLGLLFIFVGERWKERSKQTYQKRLITNRINKLSYFVRFAYDM